MIHPSKVHIGDKFGRLTVVGEGPDAVSKEGKHRRQSVCDCSCGTKGMIIRNQSLVSGKTKSCGCARAEALHARSGVDVPIKTSRLQIVNGYVMIYDPDNPSAMKEGHPGYVYLHRKVAEEILGRKLDSDEDVHHIDHDKENNNPTNLAILTRHEHATLHAMERIEMSGGNIRDYVRNTCITCGKVISNTLIKKSELHECRDCVSLRQRKCIRPSLSELEEMMKTMPMVRIASKYGVSDKAVAKWIKQYKKVS